MNVLYNGLTPYENLNFVIGLPLTLLLTMAYIVVVPAVLLMLITLFIYQANPKQKNIQQMSGNILLVILAAPALYLVVKICMDWLFAPS